MSSSAVFANSAVDNGLIFNGQLGYGQNNLNYNGKTSPVTLKKGNLFYGGGLGWQMAIIPNKIAVGIEGDIMYGRSIATVKTKNDETKVSNLLVPVMGTVTYAFDKVDLFAKGGGLLIANRV